MKEASNLEIRRALKAMEKRQKRKAVWKKVIEYFGRFLLMSVTGFGASLISVFVLENSRGRLFIEMAITFFAMLAVGRIIFKKQGE